LQDFTQRVGSQKHVDDDLGWECLTVANTETETYDDTKLIVAVKA